MSVAVITCVVSGLVACASLVVPDIDTTNPPVPEAGLDDGRAPTGDSGPKDPCAHVLPPLAPTVDDDPTHDVGPIHFLLRETHALVPFTYDAGVFDGGPPSTQSLGFDLDRGCTCQADLHPRGQNSCGAKTAVCDQDGGVDNQLPGLLTLLTTLMPGANVDELVTVNHRIAAGDAAVMISISGYNGLANDTSVNVTIHAVTRPDLLPNPDGGPRCVDAGIRPPNTPELDDYDAADAADGVSYDPVRLPAFDGCDTWGETESTPPFLAYVSNHVLVIDTNVSVPFLIAGAVIDVTSTKLTAVIVPDGNGSFTLEDGNAGARAATIPILNAVSTLRFSVEAGPLCYSTGFTRALLLGQVCNAVDTLSDPSQDYFQRPDGGGEVACDALSVGFAFRGEPAFYGPRVDASPYLGCADADPLACP